MFPKNKDLLFVILAEATLAAASVVVKWEEAKQMVALRTGRPRCRTAGGVPCCEPSV